jgi:hypothetical protein
VTVGVSGSTLANINAQLRRVPKAQVTSGPTGTTTARRPSFAFKAGPAGATAQCSIDQGAPAFAPCSGVTTHQPAADLADGAYTFRVRSTIDGRSAIATRQFTVDVPETPTGPTGPTGPTDPGPTGPTGPSDSNPPSAGPTDMTAPKLTFVKGPGGKTTDKTPTFAFTADDPAASFACSVDGKAPTACSSPFTLKKLSMGKHTITVTASDAAGNKASAERSFKVKRKKKPKS